MANTVRVRIAGALACFTRPEMKVERASYDVITPSAARGVLDAILWRPQFRWVVHHIEVLRPIRFIAFRRNEVQSKIAPQSVAEWMEDPRTYWPQPAGAGSEDATPRNTLALRDVTYVIEAEPRLFRPEEETDPVKYVAMFNRRVEKGQCFHRPYLGCREFACDFSPPIRGERPIQESRDLGRMLYDIVFRDAGNRNRAIFFTAQLQNGIVDTHPDRALSDAKVREEVLECSYRP